jgi:hypothetical protein
MTRDTLWLPTATAYTTHDRGGRPHVCPASARLATDAAFAARVAVRTAERLARFVDVAKAADYRQRTEAE